MQRRDVLRMMATGAALQFAPAKVSAFLLEARALLQAQSTPRTLNPQQYATVKTMADLLIPRTSTPGAADVGAAEFIDLILTEWYDEQERAHFLAGLADVDSRSRALFGKDFVGCSVMQQSEMFLALGEQLAEEVERARNEPPVRSEKPPNMNRSFYSMLRQLTLTAYYTSEAGATQELHYQIIPDRYEGCGIAPSSDKSPERR